MRKIAWNMILLTALLILLGCQPNAFYKPLHEDMYPSEYKSWPSDKQLSYNYKLLDLLYQRLLIVTTEINRLNAQMYSHSVQEQPTIRAVQDNIKSYMSKGYKILHVGDVVVIRVYTNYKGEIYYRFRIQPPGGCFEVVQDWSPQSIAKITITKKLLGEPVIISIEVKNADDYNVKGFCDDYTFLQYKVVP